ncbi:Fes1-domain-containing protein [Canariomyces notabilis]|uniref:Fes1-domain-containing protein n=1 Tax=Canariomyces notabilis TaxID=2074819 RepID=A0AAN6THB6_9PEZI|nr:Fes1-domain-containing protein [Canariomyces arenarius]
MDKNLNNLLKWSIENSVPSTGDNSNPPPQSNEGVEAGARTSTLDRDVLAALLGGPSDAELMKAAMEVITDPSVELDQKLIAFDNFEQLIESLDNANNLENLSLWTPLLSLLAHEERELRLMAAWCVGTAVQNNVRSQERLLAMGGIPPLVGLALRDDEHESVRKKAIYALSSAVRNYQPAMDVAAQELRKNGQDHGKGDKLDASDMDLVDEIMGWLKQRVAETAKA